MSLQSFSALSAVDVVKTYPGGRHKPRIRALDGLTLAVEAGSVFALLGPNGAGKSTAVKIFTTLSRPDSGTARVLGVEVTADADRVRHAIGLVSQRASSDPMATGSENLVLAARLQGVPGRVAHQRAEELFSRFELTDFADPPAKTYSGGMSRKLDVAIGLMHRPHVLFLDEPTTGLDPQARTEMWEEIRRISVREQMTVLLTTHYLDEADQLADRLAIVDHGRIVVEDTPDEHEESRPSRQTQPPTVQACRSIPSPGTAAGPLDRSVASVAVGQVQQAHRLLDMLQPVQGGSGRESVEVLPRPTVVLNEVVVQTCSHSDIPSLEMIGAR